VLHDIGKPASHDQESGKITFYNHDILGSRIASKIAKRLRLSKKDIQRVFTLVRYHMFYYQPKHSDASIRRFIRRVGFENVDDILDLREADRLGSGAKKTSWRLEEMKERVIEQLNQATDLTDLAINGNDLMKEFNLKPGPILGEVLDQLLEIILETPDKNNQQDLLEEARKIIETKN
jgi:poly(A) polymerase/tRNA nucleotidyltransferase (CCA-adding enzyme)